MLLLDFIPSSWSRKKTFEKSGLKPKIHLVLNTKRGWGAIKDNSGLKNRFEILPLLITLAGNTMAAACSAGSPVNIHQTHGRHGKSKTTYHILIMNNQHSNFCCFGCIFGCFWSIAMKIEKIKLVQFLLILYRKLARQVNWHSVYKISKTIHI